MNERGFSTAPVLWGLAVAGLIVFTLAQVFVAEQRRMRNRALISESLMIQNSVRVFQTENARLETNPGDALDAGWPDGATANCPGALAALAGAGNLHSDYSTSSVSRADPRMEWSVGACTQDDFTLRLQCRNGIPGLVSADPADACPNANDLNLLAVRSGGTFRGSCSDSAYTTQEACTTANERWTGPIEWTLYRAAEYPAIRNAIYRSLYQTLSANYVRGHTPDFIDPFAVPPRAGRRWRLSARAGRFSAARGRRPRLSARTAAALALWR